MRNQFKVAVLVISFFSSICFGANDLQFEGKSIDAWLNLLIGRPEKEFDPIPNKEMQQQAFEAFQRMGQREYDYLTERLASTNANAGITFAFKAAGKNATTQIAKLIALFNREEMVWGAIRCLVDIGTNSIPPLMRALSDKDAKVRWGAANALGQFGPAAAAAVPLMLDRLKVEGGQVQCSIITSLGLINQYPEKVVPELIPYLSSEDSSIRGNAAFAMIGFGKNAKAAAPKLFKLMSDDNETVRGNAAGALEHMEAGMGKDYVTLLVSNASNPDPKIREYISQELSKRGVNTNSSK